MSHYTCKLCGKESCNVVLGVHECENPEAFKVGIELEIAESKARDQFDRHQYAARNKFVRAETAALRCKFNRLKRKKA